MVELALVSQVTLSAIVQHHGQEKIAGQVNCLNRFIIVIELSGVQFVELIISFRVQFGINQHGRVQLVV